MSTKASRVRPLGAPKSGRTLDCNALAGEAIAPEMGLEYCESKLCVDEVL